jgi:hypothetical protein
MKRFASNKRICSEALVLTATLATNCSSSDALLTMAPRIVHTILSALSRFPHDVTIQTNGWGCLATMAKSRAKGWSTQMEIWAALQAMDKLKDQEAGDSNLRLNALLFLHATIKYDQACISTIMERRQELFPLLVDTLVVWRPQQGQRARSSSSSLLLRQPHMTEQQSNSTTSSSLSHVSCRLMTRLAQTEWDWRLLNELGGVDALLALSCDTTQSQSTRKAAERARERRDTVDR